MNYLNIHKQNIQTETSTNTKRTLNLV